MMVTGTANQPSDQVTSSGSGIVSIVKPAPSTTHAAASPCTRNRRPGDNSIQSFQKETTASKSVIPTTQTPVFVSSIGEPLPDKASKASSNIPTARLAKIA